MSAINDALKQLCDKRRAMSPIAANREVDGMIRDGVHVEFKDEQGRNRKERVRVIDFNDATSQHNQFLAVTQLWIQSTGVTAKAGFRRDEFEGKLGVFLDDLNQKHISIRIGSFRNCCNRRFITIYYYFLSHDADVTRVTSLRR